MEETTSTTGAENTAVESTESTATETKQAEQNTQQTESEKLDKIIQSRVDRAIAEERKKNADLQKKLDRLTKEKLSDDEIKKLEAEDREKALDEREKALQEKENRLYAIKAIKEAGLDDGSDTALEIVDLVISGANDTEETIESKVKTIQALVKKLVAAEVDKTFKANGRVPQGANVSNASKTTNSIAERLGKDRATQNKQASDVLSYYTGGKK